MKKFEYLHLGKASDLKSPTDYFIYRLLEIIPGFLSWATLIGCIILSFIRPIWIALFIIAFDVYWLIKVSYLSLHLIVSYRQMQASMKINYFEKLQKLPIRKYTLKTIKKWEELYHLIFLPVYKEGLQIIDPTIEAIINSKYPNERFIIVLATEERGGSEMQKLAKEIKQKYEHHFHKFIITVHPDGIAGEQAGKGANDTWAIKQIKETYIDPEKIPYDRIIVSAFDIDTRVHPEYFSCLTYNFLTTQNPTKKSFQPVPIYSNNLWDSPFFVRIVAASGTFWQMMQQERKERLVTFSSHSMGFQTLVDIGYWQVNMVSEDSRIFWQCYLHYDGNYETRPLYLPVYMDACIAPQLTRTMKNQYKQQRRWAWGIENFPYVVFGFIKNKEIKLSKKIYHAFNLFEGGHSWTTNALLIFMLGWLPLMVGGSAFNQTILAYNLPHTTRTLMNLSMIGLIVSATVSNILIAAQTGKAKARQRFFMFFEWIFLPFTIIFFGSIPALDAQTRLMFGKYMGFWVTEKEQLKKKK